MQRLVGQLGLGALERGDVGGHDEHVLDHSVLADLGHGPGLEPLGLAVGHDLPLGVEAVAALEHLAHGRSQRRSSSMPKTWVVRPSTPPITTLVDCSSSGLAYTRRRIAIEAGDERRRVLDQRAVALLAGAKLEPPGGGAR